MKPPIGQLRADIETGTHKRQRAHLTFRGNIKTGRHGWLRLTPAYSLHVVNEILQDVPPDECVLDPFSGTGTTTLASTMQGVAAHSVDINPFLVWLGNLKLRCFAQGIDSRLCQQAKKIAETVRRKRGKDAAWTPKLHQIEKWWDEETLAALSHVCAEIAKARADEEVHGLLQVAFCRAMIGTSNASFGHQSMSFKKPKPPSGQRLLFDEAGIKDGTQDVLRQFGEAVENIAASAADEVPRAAGQVFLGDARNLGQSLPRGAKYNRIITSPPYPNRMSYIRELRPYMYWLGFLSDGRAAGELDWQAIGGTWGCATSNLSAWKPVNGRIAYPEFDAIVRDIRAEHEILGRYVSKYFDDIKLHLQSLRDVVAPGAQCFYIVGNSKFYNTLLPVEEIYAALFADAGFEKCGWEVIRKRNSKKELFEYVVHAEAPS
jgi:hypothetical protein